jgi:hypothetical protein
MRIQIFSNYSLITPLPVILTNAHNNVILIIILECHAAERTEDASKALSEKRELKVRVTQIQKDFEEEQEQTFEMRQDMTRQYKGMQEELLSRVRELLSDAVALKMFC